MNIKWSKYIPHSPYPKQLAFLSLECEEALYGGAAGGGKSDALLMGALAYCDIPGFSSIIFRRTIADASQPASVLSRAKEWLSPFIATGEVKYRPNTHTFEFSSGAVLCIGYLKAEGIQSRYQSSEYQYIGFDELTHFYEDEYVYLFSRLRKNVDSPNIPLKMRSATNPGGTGHVWVKNRFQITKEEETGRYYGANEDAPFIPATILDNPSIDPQYLLTLDKLGKVERERLKNGDWDVIDKAQFEAHWFDNKYTVHTSNEDKWYRMLTIDGMKVVPHTDIYTFTTVDCAASEKTGVKGVSFLKDRQPSYSVISTWGITPDYTMLLLDNQRFQTSIPELVNRICENQKFWNPLYNIIEKNGPGEGVCQVCTQKGVPVRPVSTRLDKIINSTAAQLRAERGLIWLPAYASWLKEWEDEVYSWTGAKGEVNDQVDAMSNASIEVTELSVGFERDMKFRKGLKRAIPIYKAGLRGGNVMLGPGRRS
jgi:predicted phage terminase large subunit-like protein